MLVQTSKNQKKTYQKVKAHAGPSFNLLEQFKYNAFGSPKYTLLSIQPQEDSLPLDEYTDLVYAAIELRKKGVAVFFRFKNEEFILFGRYNQCSFHPTMVFLKLQLDNHTLKLKYSNANSHQKFLSRYMQLRKQSF